MTWLDVLAQSAWRGTILLAAAFTASLVLRKGPAARRHFVWTAAMAGLLLLPVALQFAPKWRVEAAPAMVQVTPLAVTGVVSSAPAAPQTGKPAPLVLWMIGCGLSAAWFLGGRVRARQALRRAPEAAYASAAMGALRGVAGIRRTVRVVESAVAPLPLTWGILRPVIALPPGSREWPADRLHAVLLHELMHVKRGDLLVHAIAQAACCFYWFHPLVWMAARQLKQERERACDDAVLLRGVAAHDYAGHLVVLARALAARRGLPAGAVTMAQRSGLESRVRALLDRDRSRQPLSRRAATAIAAVLVAVLAPAAMITAYAQPARALDSPATEISDQPAAAPVPQEARGSLTGVVKDPSGARIPGCRVRAINLDGANQETTRADMTGEYHFTAIPTGRYTVEVESPGFKIMKAQVTVAAGSPTVVNANLEIGSVSEAETVTAQRPGASPALPVRSDPRRIAVGGNVQPCKLIAKVSPVYPEDLRAQGITGTVQIRALVTKQGYLDNVQVVNTDINPGLAAAATDAVRHWLYQPTLLNGQPVVVVIAIDVRFDLAQ